MLRLLIVNLSTTLSLFAGLGEPLPSLATSGPNFAKEIKPLFQQHCADCHNSESKQSGLNLASLESMLSGGNLNGPAVIPGNSKQSPLIRYLRGEKNPRMPKDGNPLPKEQIERIAKWIDKLPARVTGKGIGESKQHGWPWTRLVCPEIPRVQRRDWVRNPIDAFVLAKLETKGLQPAPPASKRALLRRLYFGVIGLPPEPGEMQQFLNDSSPKAYRKQIEKVLADEGYGERWGRHWLDLVRYSDTRGAALDYPRPHMWRYRDYVIRAFNQDRPYDRFIREQIAGDSYPRYGTEGKIGLAYMSQWVQVERDSPQEVRRDFLTDVVSTTGSVFLGLTLGCARCHDHKFDPIPTRDYYRFEAFFAPLRVSATPLAFTQYEIPHQQPELWQKTAKAWLEKLAKRKAWQEKILSGFKQRLAKRRRLSAPADLKDLAVEINAADLKAAMRQGLLFSKQERAQYQLIRRQTALFANPNSPDYYLAKAYTAADSPLQHAVATHILQGGDFQLKGEPVEPGFLSAVTGHSEPVNLVGLVGSRRKLLAQWIAAPDNPLTARVMVNRIWQHHFGSGLVPTSSDFGKNGAGVVHRDLLDWLAWQFIESGWSIKAMHRLILQSNVYRQSMKNPRADQYEKIDAENRSLWVRSPLRLEAEVIRDSILAVSGRLNRSMGRPPFFPEVDDELLKHGPTWWEPSPPEERNRRSIYMLQIRSFPLPFIRVFDGPNIDETCPVRNMTTVTTQVFALFNSKFVHEQSRVMADRIQREVGSDPAGQVERAFQLAFQRPATESETAKCLAFLKQNRDLSDLCLVLINLNEFIFLQ
jgi:hypothetical protein